MFSENLKKIAVVSSHFNEEEIYKILPKTKYEIVYFGNNYQDILNYKKCIISDCFMLEKSFSRELKDNIRSLFSDCPFDIFLINLGDAVPKDPLISRNKKLLIPNKLVVNKYQAFFKRFIDKALSLLLIVILSPIFLFIGFLIKIETKGSIIFIQERNGKNNRKFNMFKFRSMILHDDKKVIQAVEGDKRITRVGEFLRKTSLDEIPQLFNILLGDMSLIGPRPHAVEHNEFYSKALERYDERHKVLPGITGLSQVSGLRGPTQELTLMEKRAKHDIEYIRNWSLLMDIKILLLTPISIFKNKAF
tara:strand:- start:1078 stop:1992 length:915 start_codon:yes stop_codon:yes gene_type:complete